MIPAIIACKVDRDANGHEWRSSFSNSDFRYAPKANVDHVTLNVGFGPGAGDTECPCSSREADIKCAEDQRNCVLWPLPYKLRLEPTGEFSRRCRTLALRLASVGGRLAA